MLLFSFQAQGGHFNCSHCSFVAFVAVLTDCTVECQLTGVISQDTENKGNIIIEIELCNALRHPLADICEVRCFALNYTTETNDCIRAFVNVTRLFLVVSLRFNI